MTQVLVTRTAPGAETTLARLRARGFDAIPAITAQIRPKDCRWPDGIEAIAVTSPNGARRAAELSPNQALPVYAVGDATASIMRQAGFNDVTSAAGDARALARLIVDETLHRRFVHVRGADQAFDLVAALQAHNIEAQSLIAYAAEPVEALPDRALQALRSGAILLIHSAKGATRFLKLVGAAQPLRSVRAVVISAEAARPLANAGLARIDIAAKPNEDALLAALAANPA